MKSLFAAIAAVAVLVSADRTSFDCPMRQLAVEYSAQVNPGLGQSHLQEIADALNGDPEKTQNCTVTVPASVSAPAKSRFGSFGLPTASSTWYADFNHGSDSNAGTLSAPFKTIDRALAASRKAAGQNTIVLRAGTFFQADVLNLGSQDSGLTVQAYPGEEVWISRGTPLTTLKWTAYNTSGGGWVVEQNQNAVYNGSPTPNKFAINGTYSSWQQCQAMCQANYTAGGPCTIWTWHDQNAVGYELQCWFREDGVWGPTPQADHVSGHFLPSPNTWVADVSSLGFNAIHGLRANGVRAIRARYPNAQPEFGFGSELSAQSWVGPNQPVQPAVEVRPATPYRNTSDQFEYYQAGVGGICGQPGFGFEPSVGYWCGNMTEGGGAFTWRTPIGAVIDQGTLPNQPYANPAGAIIQAWHPYRWASRMYIMGDTAGQTGYTWNATMSTGTFMFAAGGFQDARGSDDAGNFYVENVFEELDAPGEWFYNATTQLLYFWYNATSGTAPPNDGSIVAIDSEATGIVNITGTQADPVVGVSFLGVGFRDTAYTYFHPHGVPSGGDWALEREAAVFIEGAESATIDGCVFERLDGNAVMLSGYNRNATIRSNEFVWIGSSAIVSWGYTTGIPGIQEGYDGTDGNQPRYNQIVNNYIHEIGVWEKQSSAYMQAKTSDSNITGNVFFNMPRAGCNFNDGFGGGNNLTANIIFNTCRESGDHGPFNSWDRQVYVTYKGLQKDYDYISRNFLIANYESQEAVDNDDGSAYYKTFNNFMVYSGNGMKNDFGGHDNQHYSNVYAFIGQGFGICGQLPGHEDYFHDNKVIQTQDGNYGNGACSGPAKTVVYNNSVFTPTGSVSECGMTLAQWQAAGNDPGTTAGVIPADGVILQWAKQVLEMPSA